MYAFCFQESDEFVPVVVNKSVLQTLPRAEVYILKWPKPMRYQFFKTLLPDVSITSCPSCRKVRFVLSYIFEIEWVWLSMYRDMSHGWIVSP